LPGNQTLQEIIIRPLFGLIGDLPLTPDHLDCCGGLASAPGSHVGGLAHAWKVDAWNIGRLQ
jgi:hypothetical protein